MSKPQKSYKNSNKPKLSLIPKEALYAIGNGFTFGILKHGTHRYKTSKITITELLDASVRHIYQFIDGENYDKESKVNHLGAAGTNLCMAIWLFYNKPESDDRYIKKLGVKK